MQDIYCPKSGCGEPVEIDHFHEVPDMTFDQAYKAFQSKGCEGVGLTHSTGNTSMRSDASSAMMDIMGDDPDGIAAMLEDFEFFGMLD